MREFEGWPQPEYNIVEIAAAPATYVYTDFCKKARTTGTLGEPPEEDCMVKARLNDTKYYIRWDGKRWRQPSIWADYALTNAAWDQWEDYSMCTWELVS